MKTKFLIIFISAWLFMTITVDMLVLPQAFRVIGDVWVAGNLGIALFSRFNPLELALSLVILVLFVWQEKAANRKLNWKLILPVLLMTTALVYEFYLTPKIISATRVIEAMKGQTSELLANAQLMHNFYHKTYVRLDSLKLLCLLFFLGIIIWPEKLKERIAP